MNDLLDLSAARVSDTGLDLPPGLDYKRVERLIVQLAKAERSVQFWIGDALLYAEREYGDKYGQIEDALTIAGIPRSRETLRAYAWTARRIPPVLRNTRLTWWHHRVVAKLDDPQLQVALLARAETEKLSVRALRHAVRWPSRPLNHDAVLSGERYVLHRSEIAALPDLLPAGCADAVITDPLYDRDHIELYRTLSEVSAYLLKPGGILAALAGVMYLPEVLACLGDALEYFWTISYDTPGKAGEPGQRPFLRQWKPTLLFVNGNPSDYAGPWFVAADKVRTDPAPRALHQFEQSVLGMSGLVTRVSRPGDIIVDPFCGSGTTGVAALTLGRRFIGGDIDEGAVLTAAGRLANVVVASPLEGRERPKPPTQGRRDRPE